MSQGLANPPHMTASIRWPETRRPTRPQALPMSGDFRGGRLTTEPILPEHLDNPPCPPPTGLETCPFTDRLKAFTRWPATCAMPETPVPNLLLKPSLNPTRVLTRWAKLWRTPGLVRLGKSVTFQMTGNNLSCGRRRRSRFAVPPEDNANFWVQDFIHTGSGHRGFPPVLCAATSHRLIGKHFVLPLIILFAPASK
jgi:hypothetical protein